MAGWDVRRLLVVLAVLAVGLGALAQRKPASSILAPTPPMGWNSWDAYGLTIDEPQFHANVDAMTRLLRPAGYQYAVIDEGWYLANPQKPKADAFVYRTDANGRYQPALNRFPSAQGQSGFAAVAAYAHAQGLSFGIHIIRGIPKQAVAQNTPVAGSTFHAADVADTSDLCPWNPDNYGVRDTPAGQAWYDSLFAQYAAWGIDYVKVDCIASHPYKGDEIRMIHRAILKTGRPIVLSLSPGPAPLDKSDEVAANAQLWRISNDIWDHWEQGKEWSQSIKAQFAVIASWAPHVRPGNWPDADMLPLGHLGPVPGDGAPRDTRLTPDEQQTLITLWAIARSPLIVGANLTALDSFTTHLLTEPAITAMDQQGHDQRLVVDEDTLTAWTTRTGPTRTGPTSATSEPQGPTARAYIAIFNRADSATRIAMPLARFGLTAPTYHARNIWTAQDLGKISEATATIPPHGVLLLELGK